MAIVDCCGTFDLSRLSAERGWHDFGMFVNAESWALLPGHGGRELSIFPCNSRGSLSLAWRARIRRDLVTEGEDSILGVASGVLGTPLLIWF